MLATVVQLTPAGRPIPWNFVKALPARQVSVTVTFCAADGPLFVTVTVAEAPPKNAAPLTVVARSAEGVGVGSAVAAGAEAPSAPDTASRIKAGFRLMDLISPPRLDG